MSDSRKIAADQCRVVAHFARAIAEVFEDKAAMADERAGSTLHSEWVRQSDDLIETLGNILNGMDAVTDEDEWTFPIVSASVSRRANAKSGA